MGIDDEEPTNPSLLRRAGRTAGKLNRSERAQRLKARAAEAATSEPALRAVAKLEQATETDPAQRVKARAAEVAQSDQATRARAKAAEVAQSDRVVRAKAKAAEAVTSDQAQRAVERVGDAPSRARATAAGVAANSRVGRSVQAVGIVTERGKLHIGIPAAVIGIIALLQLGMSVEVWVDIDLDNAAAALPTDELEAQIATRDDVAGAAAGEVARLVPGALERAANRGVRGYELALVGFVLPVFPLIVMACAAWAATRRRIYPLGIAAVTAGISVLVSISLLLATMAADAGLGWALPSSWESFAPEIDLTVTGWLYAFFGAFLTIDIVVAMARMRRTEKAKLTTDR